MDLGNLLSSFNYTLINDFLREYNIPVSNIMDHSIFIIMVFVVWTIFINGGLVRSLMEDAKEWSVSRFWYHCSSYFKRFLTMHIYVMIVSGIVGGFFIWLFFYKGINPFTCDNEKVVINRFWILLGLFGLFSFMLSILKDVVKIRIVQSDDKGLHQLIKQSFKRFFSIDLVLLAILHLIFLALITVLFFAFRQNSSLFYLGLVIGWTIIPGIKNRLSITAPIEFPFSIGIHQ